MTHKIPGANGLLLTREDISTALQSLKSAYPNSDIFGPIIDYIDAHGIEPRDPVENIPRAALDMPSRPGILDGKNL